MYMCEPRVCVCSVSRNMPTFSLNVAAFHSINLEFYSTRTHARRTHATYASLAHTHTHTHTLYDGLAHMPTVCIQACALCEHDQIVLDVGRSVGRCAPDSRKERAGPIWPMDGGGSERIKYANVGVCVCVCTSTRRGQQEGEARTTRLNWSNTYYIAPYARVRNVYNRYKTKLYIHTHTLRRSVDARSPRPWRWKNIHPTQRTHTAKRKKFKSFY